MSVQYGSVDSDGQSKMVLMGVCGQRREHVLLLCAAASCCAAHFDKRKLGSDLSRELAPKERDDPHADAKAGHEAKCAPQEQPLDSRGVE